MANPVTTYTPRVFPRIDPEDQPRFFTQEFQNIAAAIASQSQVLGGKLPFTTYTVATLPTGVSAGTLANVSDGAAALAWGATVTGGGTASYLVRYNGTAWTVVGK